ncbi:MAG: ATP-binding protein [Gemmatimonadota bacterium]
MPVRPKSLRGHLVVLVLALAVPAIVLEGWWGYQAYREATTRAQSQALAVAERVSSSVEQFLVTTGELLEGVSRERPYRFEEPGGCENVVRTLTEVLSAFVNTALLAPDGSLQCAAFPAPDLSSLLDDGWPPPDSAASFRVGDPTHDLTAGTWVLPIAVPVELVPGGEVAALVGLIQLSEFQSLARGVVLEEGHLITIATADLQVITRSSDAAAWAGQFLPPPQNEGREVGSGGWVVSGPDAANVQRAWGIAPVPGLDWEIYVGVPEAGVNGPALRQALRRVGVTAIFLLLGILVATLSYRQIAGSLARLVERTREASHGRLVPLPAGTPAEVSAVVEQFNRTLVERHAAEEAERRALERYASIFNDAVFGIFVSTPDGRILEANPALASMLGYSEVGKVRDAPIAARFRDPDQHDIMLATCLAEGSIEGFIAEWQRADGETIMVRIDGKQVRTDDGSEALEMIVDDVTEELRRDRELHQTQKMEAIGRLAGGIAHDFNNLLTVITANAELIDEGLSSLSPVRPDLEQIKDAGDRAAALTRQLLAFSRSDTTETQDVDLNALVSDLDAMLRRLIGADISLETSLEPDLPPVHADPSRLEQVVMNLVLNARDALPGGGSIQITTTVSSTTLEDGNGTGPALLLTVEDDGEGMDDATRGRIFEPFFTTKGEGRGTGLGLATVYGIVRQIGGRIEVETDVDRGSRFRIWLPVARSIAS